MRNPNGYGSVVKLSGNRRNPFAVRKTTGFNDKGYPIYDVIGYTRTREEGNILLAEYNKKPWDIDAKKITLFELFNLYQEKRFESLGKSSKDSLKVAMKHTSILHDVAYTALKAYDMQECINNCTRGVSTRNQIKNLFSHLDKFALELDIINKKHSDLISVKRREDEITKEKIPFTNNEISLLWDKLDIEYVDTVLILLYSGLRISELLKLKNSNIDFENHTFKGGVKTQAGKNRIVPIHSKIIDLVKNRYDINHDLFLKGMTYSQYRDIWIGLMKVLNMKHTIHETRHTFRSELDRNSNASHKVSIDLIMGHKSNDTGEKYYTHKTLDELKHTIELVAY